MNSKINFNSLYWEIWELLSEEQKTNICGDYFEQHVNCVKTYSEETLIISIQELLDIIEHPLATIFYEFLNDFLDE